ncbi:MAG: hypothetical protein TECD_00719 [Hyphomicrobiaceae bacterium hypho_1]
MTIEGIECEPIYNQFSEKIVNFIKQVVSSQIK